MRGRPAREGDGQPLRHVHRPPAQRKAVALQGPISPRSDNPVGGPHLRALQRAAGNRAVTFFIQRHAVLQRLPYAQPYSEALTRKILNESEGRPSPSNDQPGHPRQHVGRWEKAERFADEQQKTKSVYANPAAQDRAVASGLSSASGQAELAKLDTTPGAVKRGKLIRVPTDDVDVKVVKARGKERRDDNGHRLPVFVGPLPEGVVTRPGAVKSWDLVAGMATRATVIVDSLGTGRPGDIHVQTAYPELG